MTIQEFKEEIQKEFNKVQVAKLVGIGFDIYSENLFGDKEYLGYCIPLNESSFEVFILSSAKLVYESIVSSIVECGDIKRQNVKSVKVIGGSGLEDIKEMFCQILLENLDLSLFDTSSAIHIEDMFYRSTIYKLLLPHKILLNNVKVAKSVFLETTLRCDLILKDFTMKNLGDAETAFSGITLNRLVIENISLPKLVRADGVFSQAHVNHILIKNIKADQLKFLSGAFKKLICKTIKIDYDNSNVMDMRGCFERMKAEQMDISNLTDGTNAIIADTFHKCRVSKKAVLDSQKHPRLFEAFKQESITE